MKRLTLNLTAAVCLLAVACSAAAQSPLLEQLRAAEARALAEAKLHGRKVLDAFKTHIEKHPGLEARHRDAVMRMITSARDGDTIDMAEAISTSLTLVDKEFGVAMVALADDRSRMAAGKLRTMLASDDPYLAAHAAYFLARAYVLTERYEDAIGPLTAVLEKHADHTLYGADALFLKGVAQANLLQRKEAIETLQEFVKKYEWTSSERTYMGARMLLTQLHAIADGTLSDVESRMQFSERRLRLADSGQRTQEEQQKIIALLEKLIEEAEEKENQGGGGGGGGGGAPSSGSGGSEGGSGGQQAGGGAAESGIGEGGGNPGGNTGQTNRTGDAWGGLPERERARAIAAVQEKFPEHYRELIEQYYRNLQDEGSRD